MQNHKRSPSDSSDTHLLPLLESLNLQLDQSYNESEDDIDEDRCYLMEIEQLKRQNNFLKKKIAELNKRHPALGSMVSKRKSLPANIKPAEPIANLPQSNYLISFFEEITRLLQSFSDLFKVGIQSSLQSQLRKEQQNLNILTMPKDEKLNRKLGRVLLEPQSRRYGQLLSVLEQYYIETSERERSLKCKVQHLTSQAIDLGKKMAENIRLRQKQKSSRLTIRLNEEGHHRSELSLLKLSDIKKTCTDSQLDISGSN